MPCPVELNEEEEAIRHGKRFSTVINPRHSLTGSQENSNRLHGGAFVEAVFLVEWFINEMGYSSTPSDCVCMLSLGVSLVT